MKNSTISLQDTLQLKIIRNIARRKKVKVYLIGGFLRDYFLNRPCLDFDFTVSREAIKLARQFARKIKGAFVLLDEDHGCARVVKKKNDRILTFDFADFRKKTLRGDLSHRDFTINTLCVDIEGINGKKQIPDLLINLKGGLKDIDAKKIKMVSARSFKEDPLRMVRAFSLRAQLGFRIDKKTLTQIKKDKNTLSEVSYERIRDELFKILSCWHTAENFKDMDRVGLIEQIIPQIYVMYDVKQGGYHHLDVWLHSLETVAQLEKIFKEFKGNKEIMEYINEPFVVDRRRFALMKLAALLHDIGKPDAKRKVGRRSIFYGHERIGKKIVREIAILLKLSVRERHALEDMVLWHLRPGYLSNFKFPSERMIFRYFRDTRDEAISILLLSLADQRATRGPLTSAQDQRHHEKIIKQLIVRCFDKKREKPLVRLIDGYDLINKLKLKPSPVFAKILSGVEEKQATGKIKTKKEALKLARKIAKK